MAKNALSAYNQQKFLKQTQNSKNNKEQAINSNSNNMTSVCLLQNPKWDEYFNIYMEGT